MNKNARVLGHVSEFACYVATVTPPLANDLFFISSYDKQDPLSHATRQHGYQRPPSKERYKPIAEYYKLNGNSALITPLIVSVRLEDEEEIERFLKLLDAGDIKTIKSAFGDKIASVVDGQHRLGGLVEAWRNKPEFLPNIPVMLFFGLSFQDEATVFNTINVTQRKLPKALIETTRGDITEVDSHDYNQRIRRLTFSLCRDEDSVWGPISGEEQINMTGVRDPDRPVTYEGLRRSTLNMFPATLLRRLETIDADLPMKYAKRYWKAVSEACADAWEGQPSSQEVMDPETGAVHTVSIKYRIKDLVGVASLAKLGKDVITSHLEGGDPTRLESLVGKLTEVDWEKRGDNVWMKSQAGFAGQKELYEVLVDLVYNDKRPANAEEAAA